MHLDSSHREELIFEAEDGNEHGEHDVAVMNVRFVIGHAYMFFPQVLQSSTGVIGNVLVHVCVKDVAPSADTSIYSRPGVY